MVCMLALFRIDKVEGSENVNWEKGLTACVVLHLKREGHSVDPIYLQASTPVPMCIRSKGRKDEC